jgi:hypothetical protein
MLEEVKFSVTFTASCDVEYAPTEQRQRFSNYIERAISEGWTEFGIDLIDATVGRTVPESEIYGTNLQPDPLELLDHSTVAENAMCLWEAYLDAGPVETPDTTEGWLKSLRLWHESVGFAEARTHLSRFAVSVEKAFEEATAAGYGDPFDWEFCPWFLSACIDWTASTPTLNPDYLKLSKAIGKAFGNAA